MSDLTGGTNAVLAAMDGCSFTLNTNAGATLNGADNVTGSAGGTSIFTSASTWKTFGTKTYSGSWSNSRISRFVDHGDQRLTNTAAGVMNFAGNATLVTNLTNLGLMEARNGNGWQQCHYGHRQLCGRRTPGGRYQDLERPYRHAEDQRHRLGCYQSPAQPDRTPSNPARRLPDGCHGQRRRPVHPQRRTLGNQ